MHIHLNVHTNVTRRDGFLCTECVYYSTLLLIFIDTFVAVTTVAICMGRTVEPEEMLTTIPLFLASIFGNTSLVIYTMNKRKTNTECLFMPVLRQ